MRTKPDPAQEELALSSVAAHALFPGRSSLYVPEVAKALEMSEQQVLNLIEEYQATGGASGLQAINIANSRGTFPGGNKTSRKAWRVPVSGYDAFIQSRKANAL